MWLASLSKHDQRGRIIGTGDWCWRTRELREAEQELRRALEGVGDPSMERLFRMNITLCLHRAVSAEEAARLPAEWDEAPGGLAGGPIEVLWQHGVPDLPQTKPCEAPTREVIDASRPDLWLPGDCGICAPCLGRAAIRPAA